MSSQDRSWLDGWRLFGTLALVLAALSIGMAGARQFEVDGVRMVIRFTARTSLLFFSLAFSAAALARFWPNVWTRWQLRNRRYLGLTFAASHALHAVAIACFANMDPVAFARATSLSTYIFGGIGYCVIFAMAATSFARTAAIIGPHAWRMLHLFGGYLVWVQFAFLFGKRAAAVPLFYGPFLIALVAVMALRLSAIASARTRRAARAG